MRRRFEGFTLLEVVIVVMIVGVIAALAFPNYQLSIERARAKQIEIILSAMAADVNRDVLEYGWSGATLTNAQSEWNKYNSVGDRCVVATPTEILIGLGRTGGTSWATVSMPGVPGLGCGKGHLQYMLGIGIRKDDQQRIGQIICGAGGPNPNICQQLGY